jgi:hypothetical protein
MHGFWPPILSSISHHKDNNSELLPFRRSFQVWLAIETGHGIGFLNRVQRGNWPSWNSIIVDFLGEYEAICETALGHESGP